MTSLDTPSHTQFHQVNAQFPLFARTSWRCILSSALRAGSYSSAEAERRNFGRQKGIHCHPVSLLSSNYCKVLSRVDPPLRGAPRATRRRDTQTHITAYARSRCLSCCLRQVFLALGESTYVELTPTMPKYACQQRAGGDQTFYFIFDLHVISLLSRSGRGARKEPEMHGSCVGHLNFKAQGYVRSRRGNRALAPGVYFYLYLFFRAVECV